MIRIRILATIILALGAAWFLGRPAYLAEQVWWALALVFLIGLWFGWSMRPRRRAQS